MKSVNKEILIAMAKGKTIQLLDLNCNWTDLDPESALYWASFGYEITLRVKPSNQ